MRLKLHDDSASYGKFGCYSVCKKSYLLKKGSFLDDTALFSLASYLYVASYLCVAIVVPLVVLAHKKSNVEL